MLEFINSTILATQHIPCNHWQPATHNKLHYLHDFWFLCCTWFKFRLWCRRGLKCLYIVDVRICYLQQADTIHRISAFMKLQYIEGCGLISGYPLNGAFAWLGRLVWWLDLLSLICLKHHHHFGPHFCSAFWHVGGRWRLRLIQGHFHGMWGWSWWHYLVDSCHFLHWTKVFALHHTEFPVFNIELFFILTVLMLSCQK